MTAKRFTYDKPLVAFAKAGVNDNLTGKTYEFTIDEILDLLNELHDEKQSVIDWIDRKIEEIKPYNSELCRATLLELKELLE